MLDRIDAALRTNSFLATLGAHALEARAGFVQLRVRNTPHLTSDGRHLATGVLFALAETAAQIAVKTHPFPDGTELRQTSGRIKYYQPASGDLIASATVAEPRTTAQGRLDVEVVLSTPTHPTVAVFTARFAQSTR